MLFSFFIHFNGKDIFVQNYDKNFDAIILIFSRNMGKKIGKTLMVMEDRKYFSMNKKNKCM